MMSSLKNRTEHQFKQHHFSRPTWCSFCSKFIWGVGKQGYKCKICKYPAHKECYGVVKVPCLSTDEEKIAKTLQRAISTRMTTTSSPSSSSPPSSPMITSSASSSSLSSFAASSTLISSFSISNSKHHQTSKSKSSHQELLIPTGSSNPHRFVHHHFSSPTWCTFCGEFIWGIGKQGYSCTGCGFAAHSKCLPLLSTDCSNIVKNAKSGEGGSTALLEKKNSVASMVTGGSTFREIRSLTKMRTRSELIQVNENADSLLHVAAQQGRDDVVQFLIRRKGLDPHVVNQHGWTALDAACYEGHLDVITTLLEEGVYAGLSTNDGSTCIHLLCKAMPKTTFPIPTEDPIIKQFGNIILSLIDAGANINAASVKGVTPLTQACMVGSLEAVYLLLKYGANIQYRNGTSGESCLDIAEQGRQHTIVTLLNDILFLINSTASNGEVKYPQDKGDLSDLAKALWKDICEHRDRPHERRLTDGKLKTQPLSKVIERCVQENQTSFLFGKREAGGAITLPSEISQLTCVKQLEIKGTKIKLLGKDICKLTQLTNLRIVGNPSLGVLPKTIGNLTQLKELLLKQNSISSLPSGIGSLTALQRLDLSGNSLESICPELGLLSQLEWLSLRGGRFADIPSQLGALTSLTYLALDKNSALSRLPVSLCQLTKLTTLLLDKENDWVIPPPDVVLAGQKSPPKILTYLGELRAQMVPCTRVKLFIVGSESGGGQGRIPFSRLLKPNTGRDRRMTTSSDFTATSTFEGSVFETWSEEVFFSRKQQSEKMNLTFNSFEFLDQDLHHAVTWPLFTKQTIFIVVVDVGRDHAFSRLAHWIRLIDMRAPGASVSIAALYSGEDLLSGYEETMKKLLLKIRERTSILVKGFAFVHSVKHQKGIESMREILKKISVEFLCDQSIPGSFVELERLLQAEAFDRDKDREKDKDRERDKSQTSSTSTGSKILFSQGQGGLSRSFIHWDEVVAKGKSLSNTPDELWLSRAVSTLNSLGYLVYPREFKSEIVILNLQHYLEVAMKTVEEALKHNGEMAETRLTEFWTSLGISPNIIPGLLVHFSYYDLVAKPRIPHDPPTYFVTTALPKEATSTFEGWDKLLSTQSSRRYELNSLPPDIFPRLIFRLLTNCRVVNFWKNGAYILDANNDETCALLKRKKRLIELTVRGANLATMLHEVISLLEGFYKTTCSAAGKTTVYCPKGRSLTWNVSREGLRKLISSATLLNTYQHILNESTEPGDGGKGEGKDRTTNPSTTETTSATATATITTTKPGQSSRIAGQQKISRIVGSCSIEVDLLWAKKKPKIEEESERKEHLDSNSIMEQGPGIPIRLDQLVPDVALADLNNFKIDHSEIEILNELGRGSFGTVSRGILRGEEVAVKSARMEQSAFGEDEDTREKAFNEFRQEAWIMSGLRHPNIVMMKGYSITPLCLVLEFVPFGELYNFINNSGEEIPPVLRLRIASDIANGMAFLHGINPPLLHRDLKSPNVLLCAKTDNTAGDGPVAKVADFGTSMRVFSARKEKDFSIANPLWLAPEMLVGGIFTPAADVYSFAVILWELAARTPPYKHIQFLHKIEEMVTKGERLTIPEACESGYSQLISECWSPQPENRPSFESIATRLSKLLGKERKGLGRGRGRTLSRPPSELRSSSANNNNFSREATKKLTISPPVKVECLSYMKSMSFVWGGCRDGSVCIWHSVSGDSLERLFKVHKGPVKQLLLVNEKEVWSISPSDGIYSYQPPEVNSNQYPALKCYLQVFSNSKWKRRFVILDNGILSFYKHDEDLNEVDTVPLGGVQIRPDSNRRLTFRLTLPNNDSLIFQAANESDLMDWTVAIFMSIERLESISKIVSPITNSMYKGVSCCVLVDASKVWAGTTNNTILVFDTGTREIASSIVIPSNISPEKKTITKMVPSGDKIWAILSNIVVQLSLNGEALNFIELKPEVFIYDILAVKQQFWICGDDKTISVWNQEPKKRQGEQQQPVKVLQQQAFCLLNTGDEIWSGGWDRKISVWTDYTEPPTLLPSQHTSGVNCMVLTEEGREVWSASWDKSICIWA